MGDTLAAADAGGGIYRILHCLFPGILIVSQRQFVIEIHPPGNIQLHRTPGTVIVIPPEVKHWHGAKADSWFSHIAVEVPGEETSNEWLEAVDDESYSKLH